MVLFGIIIGMILLGMSADAAISKSRNGKVVLSRGWYLILGLALVVPSLGAPVALLQELNNPNPNVQTFSATLTVCFLLGFYLILRFFSTKLQKAERGSGGNSAQAASL